MVLDPFAGWASGVALAHTPFTSVLAIGVVVPLAPLVNRPTASQFPALAHHTAVKPFNDPSAMAPGGRVMAVGAPHVPEISVRATASTVLLLLASEPTAAQVVTLAQLTSVIESDPPALGLIATWWLITEALVAPAPALSPSRPVTNVVTTVTRQARGPRSLPIPTNRQ